MLYGPYATPSPTSKTWTFKDLRTKRRTDFHVSEVLKCPRNHNFINLDQQIRDRSRNSEITNKGSRRRCGCRRGARPGSTWVRTWVLCLGAIGVGQKTTVEGSTRVRVSRRPCFAFLIRWRWRLRPVSGANEARSDHDVKAVSAIQCVRNML